MVQLSLIEAQLTKLGVKKTFFCRPEIRELQHILMDHEEIIKFVNGRYSGGFAILVATEQRLLLIDKKPLYLTVEDVRYDMISEVDISARLFDATVTIFTVNKQLVFSAVRQQHLRQLTAYVQQRVMEIRQYHREIAPSPAVAVAQPQVAPQLMPQAAPQPPTYSYSTTQPSEPVRQSSPSPHLPHIVGSAAVQGTHAINPNPFTREPLMIRRRWSSWSKP